MNNIRRPEFRRRGKVRVPGARRGRPLDAAKHERIVAAATQAFLELGFNATSMDLVARRAKVSKVTVYTHFKNKKSLFGAIIDGLAGTLVRASAASRSATWRRRRRCASSAGCS